MKSFGSVKGFFKEFKACSRGDISGKSVLLAYTLKKIKRDHPNAKVIVVVFTHALIKMFQAAFSEMGVAANIVTYYSFMDGTLLQIK